MIRVEYDTLIAVKGIYLVLGRREKHTALALENLRGYLDMADADLWKAEIFESFGDGMHHADVDALLCGETGLLKSDRFVFVSTMACPTIDRFYFHSQIDAQQRILFAKEDGSLWCMDEDQARMFHAAYEAGIESVSEILMTRGLW
jgi:hypothetical protein